MRLYGHPGPLRRLFFASQSCEHQENRKESGIHRRSRGSAKGYEAILLIKQRDTYSTIKTLSSNT